MNTKIKLRALRREDTEVLARIANNKKIADNLRDVFPYPYTTEDAKWFINFCLNESKDHRWGIDVNGELTGLIGLHVKEDVYAHNLEIGYWLGEEYWGNGIMSEAIKQAIEKGFKELKCHRIYAGIFANNVGSMKVLENNGFRKEGILKESIFKNGAYQDEHKYGLTIDQYNN